VCTRGSGQYDGLVDRARIVVMASGTGSILQSLLDRNDQGDWPAVVVAVVTDRPEVAALHRAEAAGVPAHVVSPADFSDRSDWDRALADVVAEYKPAWVVSAGFMRLLGDSFLADFPGQIVNTHPALLPSFPGAHGVRDALDYGVKVTGCTVHLVDSGVDTGPVLAQESVLVEPGDSEESLHERIKCIERQLLVDVVARLVNDGYSVDGRRVSIP
jgi:phosphoribosylglycinamide formyltransferase-1